MFTRISILRTIYKSGLHRMLRQLMLEGNADIGYILTRNAALRVTHSN